MKNLTSAVCIFALSIASLSFGNILLKLGMTRYDALTAAGMPAALCERLNSEQTLGDEDRAAIIAIATPVLARFQPAVTATPAATPAVAAAGKS